MNGKRGKTDNFLWILTLICLAVGAVTIVRFGIYEEEIPEALAAEEPSEEPQIEETPLAVEPVSEPVVYTEAEMIAMGLAEDKEAPVIEGVEDRSFDQGSNISYKRGITVTDNSGEEIEPVIDTGDLNSMVLGDYTVTYTATDSAGNTTTESCVFSIVVPEEPSRELVDSMAQEILDQILTEDMSRYDRAYAIFRWIHNNISYVGDGVHDQLEKAAYIALTEYDADCYGYYAVSAVLLSLADIDNVMVKRDSQTSLHYWNLVEMESGWYHFDASPRRTGDPYRCFLQTDAQVAYYGTTYPGRSDYYKFDDTGLPERGTEILYYSRYLEEEEEPEETEETEETAGETDAEAAGEAEAAAGETQQTEGAADGQ